MGKLSSPEIIALWAIYHAVIADNRERFAVRWACHYTIKIAISVYVVLFQEEQPLERVERPRLFLIANVSLGFRTQLQPFN